MHPCMYELCINATHYFILDFGICFKDRFDLTKGEAGALRADNSGAVPLQPVQVLLG